FTSRMLCFLCWLVVCTGSSILCCYCGEKAQGSSHAISCQIGSAISAFGEMFVNYSERLQESNQCFTLGPGQIQAKPMTLDGPTLCAWRAPSAGFVSVSEAIRIKHLF